MRKNLLLLVSLFSFYFISAQQASVFYENRVNRISYYSMEDCNTSDINQLKSYLETQLNCALVLSHRSGNKYSRIITFAQVKNSIEVYHGFAKVIIDNNSNSFQVISDIFNNIPENKVSISYACWYFYKEEWILGTKLIRHNAVENTLFEVITGDDNTILSSKDLALHGLPIDTTVRVKVFNPDPLTSAHKTYTAPYLDYNDSDVVQLNNERVWKRLTCTFKNDTFWLSNKYLVPFKNNLTTSFPAVYRVKDTTFDYTRRQHEFEDVMVMYHISTLQDYFNGLGFDSLGYRPTPYDAHGQKNDNSMYLPGVGLIFGNGGVDDAEDAEVITHEYTHSLREYASPGTNNGFERQSIEESFCDYISTSYKMGIDSFGWKKWAYWDGNNAAENWFGRNVASDKIYPQGLTGNLYPNSEIFSSALMRIHLKLGKVTTDRLALQTLYYLSNNISMTQAALLFIKADTTLYNGIHTDTIWRTFAETHILPWITGIAKPSTNYPEIKLINSLNFMQGKANLSVYLPQYELGTYTVTNNLQQVIVQEKFHGDNFFLASGVIKTAGIYYLTITTPTYTVTKKFMIE